jgi:hypothetical protein
MRDVLRSIRAIVIVLQAIFCYKCTSASSGVVIAPSVNEIRCDARCDTMR